jgi:hypothetical protein
LRPATRAARHGEEAYLEDDVIDEARQRLGVPVVGTEVRLWTVPATLPA